MKWQQVGCSDCHLVGSFNTTTILSLKIEVLTMKCLTSLSVKKRLIFKQSHQDLRERSKALA